MIHRIISLFNKIKKILHFDELIRDIVKEQILIEKYDNLFRNSIESGISKDYNNEKQIIVSLTTYGDRIYTVYLTIESLMNQTHKPHKIILWLAENEFNMANIPLEIKKQIKRGLTVNFTEDLKSYKKLIPTLKEYKNSLIITVDDDVIYSMFLIENFVNSYIEDPNCIYFNRGHKIKLGRNNKILPYLNWEWETKNNEKSLLNFPTGVGGVLYPPNCFDKDILSTEKFMKLAPTNDDVWFKAMSLKKGIACRKCLLHSYFHEISSTQKISLNAYNNGKKNINDVYLENVFNEYSLYEKIIKK